MFLLPVLQQLLEQSVTALSQTPEDAIFPLLEFSGRKEGNVLFNDRLNTFHLRLYGIRHMVKDHSLLSFRPTECLVILIATIFIDLCPSYVAEWWSVLNKVMLCSVLFCSDVVNIWQYVSVYNKGTVGLSIRSTFFTDTDIPDKPIVQLSVKYLK